MSVNLFQDETKRISGKDTPSPHHPRTKAVPSSLHACIRLTPTLHKVRSVTFPVSLSTCSKEVGLCYTIFTDSGDVVPALKRRNSEGIAKEERRRSEKRPAKPIYRTKNSLKRKPRISSRMLSYQLNRTKTLLSPYSNA